jgi:hypothetical protein
VGALAALGFAERAPTRLALLGTLPRKREREESYADGTPPLPRLRGRVGVGVPNENAVSAVRAPTRRALTSASASPASGRGEKLVATCAG